MKYDNYVYELKEEEAVVKALYGKKSLDIIYGLEPICEGLYHFFIDNLLNYNCYHLFNILTNKYEPIYPSTINENDIIPVPYNKKNLSHLLIWKAKKGELKKSQLLKDVFDKIHNKKIGCYRYKDSYNRNYRLIINENRVLIYVNDEKRYYHLLMQ